MPDSSDPPPDDAVDEAIPQRSWDDLLGDELAPGDVLADKYRLESLLGYGAMGFVVKAWHLQLEEPVAVKFLLPELAAHEEALVRFEREARAAFKIKSPHVARVLDVGRVPNGAPFMVMEFLEGEDLGHRIDRQPVSVPEAIDFVRQAAHAVAEAHALGIVHRDLKPDNLFLTKRRDGSTIVKVLDFGLSKVLPRNSIERQRAITAEAQVMGTAHYMSPEQWISTKDVTPATDIWSLGVILYEAIAGDSPFFRNNLAAMCNAVLHHDPEPLADQRADVPGSLDDVIRRCLQKDAGDRYQSVDDLFAALEPYGPRHSTLPPPSHAFDDTERPSASDPPRGSPPDMERLAPLPRLGLVGEDGVRERWTDVLDTQPRKRSTGVWLTLVIAVAALVVLALVL